MYKKLFYSILGASASFSSHSLFAGDNITQTDYMITVGRMDPVNDGSTGTIPGGKGALLSILQNFSEILLFIIPLIAGISLIIAGYFYIFSSGDTEKTTKAKTIIKWNIIAIFVALLSYSLVRLVAIILS